MRRTQDPSLFRAPAANRRECTLVLGSAAVEDHGHWSAGGTIVAYRDGKYYILVTIEAYPAKRCCNCSAGG